MQQIFRASPFLAVLLLAGCSMGPSADTSLGPTLAQPNPALAQPMVTPASVQASTNSPASTQSLTDVTAYLDVTAIPLLSGKDKGEAASAQFNALTFGRPGAPRAWQGDKGTSGEVTVGPYVRVNNIDCRDFTHTVTIGGKPYPRSGTACREADGGWNVVS